MNAIHLPDIHPIDLPKRWMSEMHLKAGDPVTIVRESNSLSIIPNAERRSNSANEVSGIVLQNER
jgi:antitoxin component of MazEF toxin-antitoxin module